LKDIKNRNFRKDAHSKFKKDFFESFGKETHDFLEKRRGNPNLTQVRGFDSLHNENFVPTLFVDREEVEEAILNNKEMCAI